MKNLLRAALLSLSLLGMPCTALAVCNIQAIAFGETRNATLATDDCIDNNINGHQYYYDYYEFSASSGQQIAIANSSPVIDPDLLLINPDGTTRYDDDGGGGLNARIPASGFLTLTQTGTHHIIASSAVPLQTGAYTLVLTLNAPPPPPSSKPTIEFYNIDLKHYFITAEQAEATAIDNGAAGAGWVRTGFSYDVAANQQAAQFKATAANPVCRFYAPFPGPNSHFYTVDAAECTAVKTDPGWRYEGIAYYIQPPAFGTCPAGTQPIYRVYNNRFQYNDSNHRFITNPATFLQMGERGWTMEGIVMCTTGVRAPTPVTGGTFKDPSGAGITITPGELPPYVNATQPTTTPSPRVPPGMIDPAQGDVNVTRGAPAYDVNLTGDSGFATTTAGAVTLSMPFDAAAIPPADQGDPVKTFTRIFNPQDNSQADLTGDIAINGANGMLTVETRGLPMQFTAAVIYNPNMDSVTSEEAALPAAPDQAKLADTTWPAQAWCVIYNRANPNLIAAVRNLHGLPGNPGAALIRATVVGKVAGGARTSQAIYQTDELIGPNLYIGRTACRDNTARYNLHMVDGGSFFRSNDPNEVVSSGLNHYGRLYISNDRIDDSVSTALGSVLASISHEMQHAIQTSYQLLGYTPKGYKEGAATVYGKTVDNGQVITVRDEIEMLDQSLMSPADDNAYNNEDFFAYVGKQYNGGSLNYLSGLYAQMRAAIGAGVYNPAVATMYAAMNTYFNAKFGQPLAAVYLDFVKQRALTHNASSQFGRPGEIAAGFADNLFTPDGVYTQAVNLATCSSNKVTLQWSGRGSYSTSAIVINPTGVLPAGKSNPTLVFKITPDSGALGGLWNGFTYRAGAAAALTETNKFTLFGQQAGDQVVILVSHLDPGAAGRFVFEISCAGVTIDSISPVKGPVDLSVTINGSGFGTAADTRSVTFNGVKATTVTWSSDILAVARVPQNASTGDVVVEVNGEKSNGVNFEVIAQCSATQNAGGDTPDTRTIELGKPAGTFVFTYETYSQQDRIIVRYQGATLFDTGCVGANGSQSLPYSGTSTQISVQVIPNCQGGSGTAWNYSVSCP
ncbi:MAG: IPT/TIG domain-containing protein [Betaproteobacteria bacterium]|nr:IPT/TIG domain-containing protein [Betaproteobacteria bacterium]